MKNTNQQPEAKDYSDYYNKGIAIALAIFLGGFGIHKFYQGKYVQGVIYLLFAWTFVPAVLAIVDAILIAATPKQRCTRN